MRELISGVISMQSRWAPDEGAHQWCDDQHAIKVGTQERRWGGAPC